MLLRRPAAPLRPAARPRRPALRPWGAAAVALAGLGACQTAPKSSDPGDAARPFPFEAWVAAEQRLRDSPTPYHIQPAPQPVEIRGAEPGRAPVHPAAERLAGRVHIPQNPGGPRRILVDLARQRAWVLRGDWVEAVTRVSTGRAAYPTPPGPYVVAQKSAEHRSNLYGNYVDAEGKILKKDVDVRTDPKPEGAVFEGSPMPFFLRLRDPANKIHGVGFHAGQLPGYPASHGCIRLPAFMARWLFDTTKTGTPVHIIPYYPLPEAAPERGRPGAGLFGAAKPPRKTPAPRPDFETRYF